MVIGTKRRAIGVDLNGKCMDIDTKLLYIFHWSPDDVLINEWERRWFDPGYKYTYPYMLTWENRWL